LCDIIFKNKTEDEIRNEEYKKNQKEGVNENNKMRKPLIEDITSE
jgi:hypothetical protein